MNLFKSILFIAVLGVVFSSCFLLKNKKPIPPLPAPTETRFTPIIGTGVKSQDTFSKQHFREVVTGDFKTDSGFFNIHQLDEKYFLEIPDTLLGRDILLVNRIVKAAADNRMGFYGFSGDEVDKKLIRFKKGLKQKMFIERVSYNERAHDNSVNGMYRSLQQSVLLPIVATFDIKTRTQNDLGSVIDISEFIANEHDLLGFGISKATYKLTAFQKDKSYVMGMKAFETNLELQTQNTYASANGLLTYQLNNSFVLLPEKPMTARYFDKRVGYFEESYMDFDQQQGASKRSIITRFRLEPKPEDIARYLSGELVEPVKPIVYYIDPATPKKWVKYMIRGVNDWQKAFEKAGFKNAIYALEAPLDKEEWSLFDAKHNAVIYMPSSVANAVGPRIYDPRSGEILETHITWFHNMITKLQEQYLVQVGPNDPRGRKMEFDDELMGRLIQYVCSHEVGHTLGLRHNFIASSSVPVDSLRSKSYLQRNGYSPSIMDYSRFNYVAQPKDRIPVDLLVPNIGAYDEWVINWGYRWFPDQQTQAQQLEYMNKWTTEQLQKDARLVYAGDFGFDPTDARVQTEDIGDDATKASSYGMENLQIVYRNLIDWTKTPEGDYSNLVRMTNALFTQYSNYLLHVTTNIRMGTQTVKIESEGGDVLGFVPKQKKIEAIGFLNNYLFNMPRWLMNDEIFRKTGISSSVEIGKFQVKVLDRLLREQTFNHMLTANRIAPLHEQYSFDQMLIDLKNMIFRELKNAEVINVERRFLQRVFVEQLIGLYHVKDMSYHEMVSLSKYHSADLITLINRSLPHFKDRESKTHLSLLIAKLQQSTKDDMKTQAAALPVSSRINRVSSCCGGLHL